jgi:hypothetical protein
MVPVPKHEVLRHHRLDKVRWLNLGNGAGPIDSSEREPIIRNHLFGYYCNEKSVVTAMLL